jgi:hypothetical protein
LVHLARSRLAPGTPPDLVFVAIRLYFLICTHLRDGEPYEVAMRLRFVVPMTTAPEFKEHAPET